MSMGAEKTNIIFIIASSYPYYAGGIENWLENITSLVNSNYNCIVLSEKLIPMEMVYTNADMYARIEQYTTLRNYRYIKPLIRSYGNILDMIYCIFSKYRALKNIIEIDKEYIIIALDTVFNPIPAILLKKKNRNVKVIISSRGPHREIFSEKYPICKKLFIFFEKISFKNADEIWANGKDTQKLIKKKGYTAVLMKNGVDFEKYSTAKKTKYPHVGKVILNASTLIDVKHIRELILAYKYIKEANRNDIVLYFIGKGDQKKYSQYATELGINDGVYFLGHKNNIHEFMKSANVLTCLSGGGGMSMAALESMASGIPVVAWDTPIYRQFCDNSKCLMLVPYLDCRLLANNIIDIIDNPKKYKKCALEAQKIAGEYDWEYVKKDFIDNITKVLV